MPIALYHILAKRHFLTKRRFCDSDDHDTIVWLHSLEQLGKRLLEAFGLSLRINGRTSHVCVCVCVCACACVCTCISTHVCACSWVSRHFVFTLSVLGTFFMNVRSQSPMNTTDGGHARATWSMIISAQVHLHSLPTPQWLCTFPTPFLPLPLLPSLSLSLSLSLSHMYTFHTRAHTHTHIHTHTRTNTPKFAAQSHGFVCRYATTTVPVETPSQVAACCMGYEGTYPDCTRTSLTHMNYVYIILHVQSLQKVFV